MSEKKYALLEIPQIRGKYSRVGEGWIDNKIELPKGKQLYHVSTIMRAKPPHRNHIAMLESICQKSVEFTINIGSSNKLDDKNPFYPNETEDMLRLGLKDYSNFKIIPIPDFHDDEKWADYLFSKNPDLTEFVCNNDWVLGILKKRQLDQRGNRKFDIIMPDQIISKDDMVYEGGLYISATVVREAMVKKQKWERYLVPDIANYIKKNNLVDRVVELCGPTIGKVKDYE
jgi:nicotinamide mononucleotide adenylyltransferase